jgi:hypothetical protein
VVHSTTRPPRIGKSSRFAVFALGWRVVLATLVSLVGAGVAGAAVPRFSAPKTAKVGVAPARMIAADLNRDGKSDLATVDLTSATLSVLLGKGNGSFRERIAYKTARHPAGIAVGDVDGDNDLDLITASIDKAGSILTFTNRGRGRVKRSGM